MTAAALAIFPRRQRSLLQYLFYIRLQYIYSCRRRFSGVARGKFNRDGPAMETILEVGRKNRFKDGGRRKKFRGGKGKQF